MTTTEILLVDHRADDAVNGAFVVLAQSPPHVVVVRADVADVAEVARLARFALVRTPAGVEALGDKRVLDDLDDSARLFVAAWQEQRPYKPDRVGEGLSWDHAGFEPPDPPP